MCAAQEDLIQGSSTQESKCAFCEGYTYVCLNITHNKCSVYLRNKKCSIQSNLAVWESVLVHSLNLWHKSDTAFWKVLWSILVKGHRIGITPSFRELHWHLTYMQKVFTSRAKVSIQPSQYV